MKRLGTYGVLALGLALVGGALWSLRDFADEPATPSPDTTQAASTASGESQAVQAAIHPSFDIVRISPEGDTVIAGRAAPGAEIAVYDGDTELGRVKADERGEWVFLPEKPLLAGSRRLNLAVIKDGEPVEDLRSEADVVLVVPEGGHGEVVAVQMPEDGSVSKVLQRPGDMDADTLSLAAIDYDQDGRIGVSGSAPAQVKIIVYVDDKDVGSTQSADNGDWHLQTTLVLNPGDHRLRADHVDAAGKVIERAEVKFSVAAGSEAPKDVIVVVEPGNSLWRIARQIYGKGTAYTLIFEANRSQIRNPDLIYPGQKFVTPKQKEKAGQ